jgi:Uma2 family endonuclease
MSEQVEARSGYTVDGYFELVKQGSLQPDDQVELLDGTIVAEPPRDPEHAASTSQIDRVLRGVIGRRAAIRVQLPLVLGPYSAPEPDVAVVPGDEADYSRSHPATALLVVEVAGTTLPKDRLSKSRIYASAGICEYWLVNLQDDCVEVFRQPTPAAHCYSATLVADRGDRLSLVAFPDANVAVADLLPRREPR